MTKKDLVKIIREVVKREVQKEVKKIFINEEPTPKLENMISSKVSKPKKQKQTIKPKSLKNHQQFIKQS